MMLKKQSWSAAPILIFLMGQASTIQQTHISMVMRWTIHGGRRPRVVSTDQMQGLAGDEKSLGITFPSMSCSVENSRTYENSESSNPVTL